MMKYILGFVLVTAVGILYEKYQQKFLPDEELRNVNLIKQFLLNDSNNLGKPVLWIHTENNVNARNWKSFYSRNTRQLNQPYIISCIETIIRNCGTSFNICLINDTSFRSLLGDWDINLDNLSGPVKKNARQLGLSKLLYSYGGLLLPNSTIVTKNLRSFFDRALQENDFFAVEGINKSSTADMINLLPMENILGCRKKSKAMNKYIFFLERKLKTDYTDEGNFLGGNNKFLYQLFKKKEITLIEGKVFGIIDKNCKTVTLDRLMSNEFIEFDNSKLHSIIIPSDELLTRTQYQWFVRLSQKQLRTCENNISKYLLISQE